MVLAVMAGFVVSVYAEDKDTDKAAATRALLKTKVTVEYSNTLLQDVAKDLSDLVKAAANKEFPTKIDPVSGASQNLKITYKAKDMTVEEILDGLGKKFDLGYIVISGKYKTYAKNDGFLLVVKGSERGYPDKK